MPAVREQLKQIDTNQPISNVISMEQVVAETIAQQRLSTLLLATFAAAGLMLTAIGLYGVVSYSATQQGAVLAATGVGVGVLAAIRFDAHDVKPVVRNQPASVDPTDSPTSCLRTGGSREPCPDLPKTHVGP